ncbi:MAG: hypothetical protein GY795_21465 [Desulfobacterales bacterium]|nr:hypothetical protein [Desulfobacterales bacterium]
MKFWQIPGFGIQRPAGFPKPRRSAARLYPKIYAWVLIMDSKSFPVY